MWISEKLNEKKNSSASIAENGSVTIGGNENIETSSSENSRNVLTYTPYGYSSSVPSGEEVLLIDSNSNKALVGTKNNSTSLSIGEVLISSKGNATIKLLNDGSVVINGLVINSKGEIVNGQ